MMLRELVNAALFGLSVAIAGLVLGLCAAAVVIFSLDTITAHRKPATPCATLPSPPAEGR